MVGPEPVISRLAVLVQMVASEPGRDVLSVVTNWSRLKAAGILPAAMT
jgi:hypothetical protein